MTGTDRNEPECTDLIFRNICSRIPIYMASGELVQKDSTLFRILCLKGRADYRASKTVADAKKPASLCRWLVCGESDDIRKRPDSVHQIGIRYARIDQFLPTVNPSVNQILPIVVILGKRSDRNDRSHENRLVGVLIPSNGEQPFNQFFDFPFFRNFFARMEIKVPSFDRRAVIIFRDH